MRKSLLFVCIALFAACTDDANVSSVSDKDAPNPHAISQEQALASLKAFLDSSPEEKTRAGIGDVKIGDVFAVKFKDAATRAGASNDVDCENLVYVANFEDEGGFAVLAADDRISDEVIAVTSDGNLSEEAMLEAMEDVSSEERQIVDGYPLTGDGFFTVDEYPDEVFMNPNTVSLHDSIQNDDLVGNFSLDDDEAEEDSIAADSVAATRAAAKAQTAQNERMVSAMCLSYAIDEVCSNGSGASAGAASNTARTVTERSAWSNDKVASPILSSFSRWHQNSPFNDLYPQRRKYLLFGTSEPALAGCFPLAISKLMTQFEFPSKYTYNDYSINWKALKQNFESTTGAKSAAHLLRGISNGCGCLYFSAGTFTFPGKAISFMKSIGFANVQRQKYSYSKITEMIDKGCPLIIYAVPRINIFNSHSWNIDGYKVKSRTVTTKKYVGSTLQSETKTRETCKMVHCDFGWKGLCNGYYVSGIFKLNSSDVEYDRPYRNKQNQNYNTYIHIITYDRPV